jgi:hypothetical protein
MGPWFTNMHLDVYHRALAGGGEFIGGEAGPGEENIWHWSVIGLTTGRLVVVVWPEGAPARSRWRARGCSVSGEARGGEVQHVAMKATMGSREEVGTLGRRRESAEV